MREKAIKGLKNPQRAFDHLYSKGIQPIKKRSDYWLYRKRNSIELQKNFIHDFVTNDSFLLVVLDACRYDEFSRIYDQYLEGEIKKVWASGRWTAEYAERTWSESYNLTYIAGIPVFSDFYFDLYRDTRYRPEQHIENVVHVWDYAWDPDLGTTPPHEITDEALRHAKSEGDTRIVAHYAQPHAPYIGEDTVGAWSTDDKSDTSHKTVDFRDLLRRDSERPTQSVLKKIRAGDLDKEDLKRAYRSNLRCVMQEVVRLVRRVDCPVVLTADHGEHLGEKGYYLHEEDSKLIRQVPWFTVDETETNLEMNEADPDRARTEKTGRSRSEEEIEERLSHLGYR